MKSPQDFGHPSPSVQQQSSLSWITGVGHLTTAKTCGPDCVITESLMAAPLVHLASTSEYMIGTKNGTGILHDHASFTGKSVACPGANVD